MRVLFAFCFMYNQKLEEAVGEIDTTVFDKSGLRYILERILCTNVHMWIQRYCIAPGATVAPRQIATFFSVRNHISNVKK